MNIGDFVDYYSRPSLDGSYFQPLDVHIKNVAELAALFGKRNNLESICRLAGFLHDMGKYSPEFQLHIRKVAENNQKDIVSKSSSFDHGSYGAAYLYEDFLPSYMEKCNDNKRRALAPYFVDFLSMCTSYHHGGLADYLSVEKQVSPFKQRLRPFIDGTTTQTSLAEVKSIFFRECIDKSSLENIEALAFEEFFSLYSRIGKLSSINREIERISNQRHFNVQLIIKFMYSCLIDADRLDSFNFSAGEPITPEKSIVPFLDEYITSLNFKLDLFDTTRPTTNSEIKIADLRAKISEECSNAAKWDTGAYTLTVPTGGGKTLASLRFALEHAKYHAGKTSEKTQIIYVLPYTTIIEQNAEEVRKTLNCSSNLLEHHSAVNFSEEDSDTLAEEYKLLAERWDVPIIFTTQVQFLNTLFSGGGSSLRKLHTLANSIIILDEIQTLPLECTYMSNAAFNTLSTLLNSTIILCSATQPNLESLDVPVQLTTPKELTNDPVESASAFKRMEVVDVLDEAGRSYGDFIEWLNHLLKEEDSILIVMNTKSGVKHVYDALIEKNKAHHIYYLTTYLCPEHRRERIDDIKNKLEIKRPVIVVSTNLIECGVDLSFRYVIRNLAGIPSIVQSSGRGNRHGEFSISQTYIVNIEESIAPLKELKVGQRCTSRLLYAFSRNAEYYNNSLLSQKSIDKYYEIYSKEAQIKEKMGYPIYTHTRKGPLQAYDLLSERDPEHTSIAQKQFGLAFSYPFRFVSHHFHVIDQVTSCVLTPFNRKAIELQGLLMSQRSPIGELRKYFREIQQYTVNVYNSDLNRLRKNGDLINVPGTEDLYVLRDGAYSREYGVHKRGEMREAIL